MNSKPPELKSLKITRTVFFIILGGNNIYKNYKTLVHYLLKLPNVYNVSVEI